MMTESAITLALNRVELHVLVYCLEALDNFFNRKPPDNKESQEAVHSALKKTVPTYLDSLIDPYDRRLEFSSDEQKVIDFALHMTMTDAVIAKKYGPVADANIGPDVRLSDLAQYTSVMAGLLRRIEVTQRLTLLERQVKELSEQLE